MISTFLLAACASSQPGPLTQWTLQREGGKESYKVTVPCTVAGALNEAGFFGQDILEQERYKNIDASIFDSPWVYTTRFATAKGLHHILRFEGLNFYADIELNGQKLASADTTFGPYIVREFDITSLARRNNTLKVTVRRAQKGDLNHGYVDWNPSPVDESMGIIRPVQLISTPDVQIQDVYIKPVVDPEDLSQARLLVNSILVNHSEHAADGVVSGMYEGGEFTVPVHLEAGESREISVEETVNNPRIWWTREMGSPELYHMNVAFKNGEEVSHSRSVTFGIRSIEGYVDEKGHRQFVLNGRPVLIKGGGWSDDIFMQDTPESLAMQARMALDMGLNCIRFEDIWGKEDTIYDLCDSLGLMALVGWSCQWEWENYCGLPEYKRYGCINDPRSEALAVRYFHDQLIRLRNHPSVIGWLTGSDRIPNPQLEEQYLKLYKELDYRPYVCSASGLSSLDGPSGMKMAGPYEYVGPDYWWIDTECGGAFGFNTETGPGLDIVQEESLRRMVGEKDLWPIGPSWAYHCTASGSHMNNTSFQENAMEGTYGKATDLKDYLRKAHAMDYDATRVMFEAFRGNVPNATGIVMWMLNSAWPSLYWQMYDWYGVPTAGYYGTKNANQPVQLVYNYADKAVYAVNDAVPEAEYKALMKVYDPASKLVRVQVSLVKVAPRQPLKVFEDIEGDCFLALELKKADETLATNFYAIPAKGNDYNWKKADWWGIPFNGFADLSFVSNLPKAEVTLDVAPVEEGLAVTLTNKSEVIAYQNILQATGEDGHLVPGPIWSQNFFTLCPGESRTVLCTAKDAKITLEGWNAKLAE